MTATECTVDQALTRGRTYTWQVAALVGGREVIAPHPSEPPAIFRVLEQPIAAELDRLPPSRAVRVVLYARAGLLDDAERELAALASMNPGAEVLRRWDDQLKAARPSPRR